MAISQISFDQLNLTHLLNNYEVSLSCVQICKCISEYLCNRIFPEHPNKQQEIQNLNTQIEFYILILGRMSFANDVQRRALRRKSMTLSYYDEPIDQTKIINFDFDQWEQQEINFHLLLQLMTTVINECIDCIQVRSAIEHELFFAMQCRIKCGEFVSSIRNIVNEKIQPPEKEPVIIAIILFTEETPVEINVHF